MKPIIFSFPGQGSQYVGMGKNLLDSQYKTEVQKKFEKASEILGYDSLELCLKGPEDKLLQTEFTQPMIFLISSICSDITLKKLKQLNLNLSLSLGHSIGEYSALYSQGVISFQDGLLLTKERGKAMQEATPIGIGSMHAILRVPEKIIIKLCKQSSNEFHQVVPANFNTPGQIVISGHKEACELFLKNLENEYKDPYRTVELKVSAPFHSPLMKPASEGISKKLESISLSSLNSSYIANVDAKTYDSSTSPETIKKNLIDQITGSVLWTQSIMSIPENALILEMGPGFVTSAMIRKINRSLKVLSFDKLELEKTSLDSFAQLLEI